jgi:hypothetical protein
MATLELEAAGHRLHKCNDERCNICTGGLAYCVVCKRGESEFWDDSGNVVQCKALDADAGAR